MMWNYGYGSPMIGYEGFSVVHAVFSIFWVVFWIVLIVTAIRWLRRGGKHMHLGCHGNSNALDILKERYAKGEIDKAEFEEKKKDLSN